MKSLSQAMKNEEKIGLLIQGLGLRRNAFSITSRPTSTCNTCTASSLKMRR